MTWYGREIFRAQTQRVAQVGQVDLSNDSWGGAIPNGCGSDFAMLPRYLVAMAAVSFACVPAFQNDARFRPAHPPSHVRRSRRRRATLQAPSRSWDGVGQPDALSRRSVVQTGRAENSVGWRLTVSEIFRQFATVSLQLTDVRCDSFDLRLAEITRNGLHSR